MMHQIMPSVVETGEAAPRTVVSGLVEHVPIEQMQVTILRIRF